MNKRAQILTIDLLISIFVFILVFTSVIVFLYSLSYSSNPYSSYYVQYVSNSLNSMASAGVNTLTGSPGVPVNWTSGPCSGIKTLGVMYNYYEASPQKLYNLTTVPSGCLSQLIRGGASFNISVSYVTNGSTVKVGGVPISAGFPVPSNPRYISSIQRFEVLYPGSTIVVFTFKEWLI
jgi:hypothetical protein